MLIQIGLSSMLFPISCWDMVNLMCSNSQLVSFGGHCLADGLVPVAVPLSRPAAESHHLQLCSKSLGSNIVALVIGMASTVARPQLFQPHLGFQLHGKSALAISTGFMEQRKGQRRQRTSFGCCEFHLSSPCHGSQMGFEFATGWITTCGGCSRDLLGATWSNLGIDRPIVAPKLVRWDFLAQENHTIWRYLGLQFWFFFGDIWRDFVYWSNTIRKSTAPRGPVDVDVTSQVPAILAALATWLWSQLGWGGFTPVIWEQVENCFEIQWKLKLAKLIVKIEVNN